jgi:hypothetical protein
MVTIRLPMRLQVFGPRNKNITPMVWLTEPLISGALATR